MAAEKTQLHKRIESGKKLLLAELSPPKGADPATLRASAKALAGKVHAVGVNDNRDGVRMSALAAAALIGSEVEPIVHMTTRDRNRIALISDCLGAQALGIRNILCTTGSHQTLGPCKSAKNVFDLDSIQLLQICNSLGTDGSTLGEESFLGTSPLCLGSTASPFADPREMQVVRLAKGVTAGSQFVITQPVYDVDRFELWWGEVVRRGLQDKVAIVAGIQPLACAETARAHAAGRPSPMIPAAVLERISSAGDKKGERAAGIEIAVETVKRLSGLKGLRGFELHVDGDVEITLELLEKSGLRAD